jgi:hypothetical protein
MDDTDSTWAAILDALPTAEELAQAVAEELGEPLDAVLPTVLIGTVLRQGRPGTDDEVVAAIESERARVRRADAPIPAARLLEATTQEDLLATTERLDAAGSLDLDAIVTIQRTSGAIAARGNQRLVLFLARYGVIRRISWERCVAEMRAGRLAQDAVADFARYIMLWNELTSLAVTDGYRAAERDILARDAEARRGALQELLGVVPSDTATTARLRRVATRHGLNPDGDYRLIAIAPRPEADPIPERPGIGPEELEVLAGRIGHLLGSTAPGAEGVGAGIRLPAVLPLHGRIAVLARADWAGLARVPAVLDSILGGLAAAAAPAAPASRRRTPATAPAPQAWVAVGSEVVEGVTTLATTYADIVDATRTARRLGLRGWIPDPERLAVERLLLADRALADAAIHQELGPLLADERMGGELVETLQAYFDAGENMREAARRLNLATRTVAYRLEKIEALLGEPIGPETRRRLSVALMVQRLRDASA